jgi:hypothetical protein
MQSKTMLSFERKNQCVMPIFGPLLTFSTRKAVKKKTRLLRTTVRYHNKIFCSTNIHRLKGHLRWITEVNICRTFEQCREVYGARQLESTLWGYIRYSGWLLGTINEAILVNPLEP